MPRHGNNGKDLESLVAFIEKAMMPKGMEVKSNRKLRNDKNVNTAEFDVEVRGKLGAGQFSWLIECRDRPKSGRAGAAWIQQIAGKRDQHKFDRATAVSTTGFTPGATEAAERLNVELRVVQALRAEDFEGWLLFERLTLHRQHADMKEGIVVIAPNTVPEAREALSKLLPTIKPSDPILRSTATGVLHCINDAFNIAHATIGDMHADLIAGEPPVLKRLTVAYPEDDHYEIETGSGIARVLEIRFAAEYFVTETMVPFQLRQDYRNFPTGEPISQLASFAPVEVAGSMLSMEFHKMADTGETHVAVRNLGAVKVEPPEGS